MKKLLYLLLVVPFAMMISSCSSDKDLPNVDITISFDNAAVDDGIVYVLADQEFSITGITTKAVNSDKQSAIANVRYFWNGIYDPGMTWSNLPMVIDMAEMPQPADGENILTLRATLLETDKSIAYTALNVPIKSVASVEDLPEGSELGQTSLTFTNNPQTDKE